MPEKGAIRLPNANSPPNSADRLRAYRWKPGQSGNPRGRPRGVFRKTALKQLIKRVGEDGVAQLEELVAEMEKERKRRPAGFRYTADDAAINIRWIAQALAARADAEIGRASCRERV